MHVTSRKSLNEFFELSRQTRIFSQTCQFCECSVYCTNRRVTRFYYCQFRGLDKHWILNYVYKVWYTVGKMLISTFHTYVTCPLNITSKGQTLSAKISVFCTLKSERRNKNYLVKNLSRVCTGTKFYEKRRTGYTSILPTAGPRRLHK